MQEVRNHTCTQKKREEEKITIHLPSFPTFDESGSKLTVTAVDCGTKGKEIRRSCNGDGSVVVVTMMFPFARFWHSSVHGGLL